MTAERLNPHSTIAVETHGSEMAVRVSQPTEPVLDLCSSLRSVLHGAQTRHGTRLAAKVPAVLHDSFMREWKQRTGGAPPSGPDFQRFLNGKLNSREFRAFRIVDGRL